MRRKADIRVREEGCNKLQYLRVALESVVETRSVYQCDLPALELERLRGLHLRSAGKQSFADLQTRSAHEVDELGMSDQHWPGSGLSYCTYG